MRCGDRRRVDYPFNCIGAACVERGGASGCTWPYVDVQCRTPRQQWQHMLCIACDNEPINAWQQQAEAERAAAAAAAALRLERDYLCVQGPPGTSKTFVVSRAAAALIAAGRRVGVLAHARRGAQHGREDDRGALARGRAGQGRQDWRRQGGGGAAAARLRRGAARGAGGERVGAQGRAARRGRALVGGTAWAFSSQVDMLLVDEAGQLPLANLVGASRAADSLVLLGDQMQLPAPCEGTHPAESGRSGLEYLLRGEPTVPPSLGVSLSEPHRLHPALCSLVSELVYSGRLSSHASAARRSLALGQRPPAAGCPPRLRSAAGVECVDVEHRGNSQSSSEEARVVAELCDELLATSPGPASASPTPTSASPAAASPAAASLAPAPDSVVATAPAAPLAAPPAPPAWPPWHFAKYSDSLLHPTAANIRTSKLEYYKIYKPFLIGDIVRRSPGRAASSDGTFRIMGRTKSDGEVPLPPPPGMPSTSRGSHKRLLPSPGSGAHHRRGALHRRLVHHAIRVVGGAAPWPDRLPRPARTARDARPARGLVERPLLRRVPRRDQARARPRLAYLACPVQGLLPRHQRCPQDRR